MYCIIAIYIYIILIPSSLSLALIKIPIFDQYNNCSWSPKIEHEGKPWKGPDQFEDSTGKLQLSTKVISLVEECTSFLE